MIHLGDGQWIVVDSCIDRLTRRPVALDYLEQLQVNITEAVKLIVVTHWHDDHIRGISTVAREAHRAELQ